MTAPKADRNRDARIALLALLERVGDGDLMVADIRVDDPAVNGLLRTTWSDLEDMGCVKDAGIMGPPRYQLTELGWLKALELSGQVETLEFQRRVKVLLAAVKATVKSRDEEGDLDVRTLSVETGLPLGWICNAVSAQLLACLFPGRGYDLEMDGALIIVPPNFGHEPLEI